MSKRTMVVILSVFALALAVAACQKLEPVPFTSIPSVLPPAKVLEPIPLDYGELVAVDPVPDNPYWFALWFQKPDKTIAVVYVNVSQGQVVPRASIPRK